MLRLHKREKAPPTPALPRRSTPELTAPELVTDAPVGHRVEAYLDSIEGKLRGASQRERIEIRRELRAHLLSAALAYEELGEEPAQAAASAIERFGNPEQIAERFAQTLRQTRRDTVRASWNPLVRTFGTAAVLLWLLQLLHWLIPHSGQCWMVTWTLLGILATALPILSGIRVALAAPKHAAWRSLAVLSLLAGLTSPALIYVLSHTQEQLNDAIYYLAYFGLMFLLWIPVGTLSAALTRLLVRSCPRPTDRRTTSTYALHLVAGATGVDAALSLLLMLLQCEAVHSGTPACWLFYGLWFSCLSPLIIGARIGWETGRLALRSSWRAFTVTAVCLGIVAAAVPGRLGYYGPLDCLRNTLLICAFSYFLRMPVSLLGAKLGCFLKRKQASHEEPIANSAMEVVEVA